MTPAEELHAAALDLRDQAARGIEFGYDPQIPAAVVAALADILDRAALGLTCSPGHPVDTSVLHFVPVLELIAAGAVLGLPTGSQP